MTAVRQVLPDKILFVTRSCVGRQHLLHGCKEVNETFEYLLAVASGEFNIRLVAYVVMSNHTHIVCHDPDGRLPAFNERLNGLVARSVNSFRGRSGAFWEAEQVNVAELADREIVMEKVAYTLANPTLAGLVERGEEWIGLRSRAEDYERPRVVSRPEIPFFENGTMPETAVLQLWVPPSHAHMTPSEFGSLVTAAAGTVEQEAREAVRGRGGRFMGPTRLRALSWRRVATTARERGRGRVIKPTVLATTRDVRKAVLARMRAFCQDYRRALTAFREGIREVLFPDGTYWLRVHLGIATAPPP